MRKLSLDETFLAIGLVTITLTISANAWQIIRYKAKQVTSQRVTGVRCTPYTNGLFSLSSMNLKPLDRTAKPQRPNLLVPNASRSQLGKRRSTRMALNASVGLSGQDRQKLAFTLRARATNLNRHGAAVALHRDLQVGTTIIVQNQRGVSLPARVVAQLASLQGMPTYAIEFLDKEEKGKSFWGITFPSGS